MLAFGFKDDKMERISEMLIVKYIYISIYKLLVRKINVVMFVVG